MKFLVLLALAAIAVAIPPEKIEADLNQLFVDVGALESATKASAGPTPPKRATKASAGPTPPKRATKASAGPTPPKTEPVDDWGRPLYFFPARDGSKKTEFLYTEYQLTGTNRGRLSDPDETINGGRSILIGGSARKITRAVAVGGGGTRKTPMVYQPGVRQLEEEEEMVDVLVQDNEDDNPAMSQKNYTLESCEEWVAQAQEGSTCWAHATAGALQRRLCIENRRRTTMFNWLSYRDTKLQSAQLYSCVDPDKNTFENGGSPLNAYRYIMAKFIKLADSTFPSFDTSLCSKYEAPCDNTSPLCPYSMITLDEATSGWVRGEREMRRAIYEGGPITSIMWLPMSFREFDGKGVYVPTDQDQEEIRQGTAKTHVVQVIGWGVEDNPRQKNVPYWVIVNTWGLIYSSVANNGRMSSLATGRVITFNVRACSDKISSVTNGMGMDYEKNSLQTLSAMMEEPQWNWFKPPFMIQVNSNEPKDYLEYVIVNKLRNMGSITDSERVFLSLLRRGGERGKSSWSDLGKSSWSDLKSLKEISEDRDIWRDPDGNVIIYVYPAIVSQGSVFKPTLKIHRGLHSFWKDGQPSDALGLEYNPSFFGGIRIRKDARTPKMKVAEVPLKGPQVPASTPREQMSWPRDDGPQNPPAVRQDSLVVYGK